MQRNREFLDNNREILKKNREFSLRCCARDVCFSNRPVVRSAPTWDANNDGTFKDAIYQGDAQRVRKSPPHARKYDIWSDMHTCMLITA